MTYGCAFARCARYSATTDYPPPSSPATTRPPSSLSTPTVSTKSDQAQEWVGRLHPGLLKLCDLSGEDLAVDPNLMSTFHERLRAAERERRPAFVTFGQKDLLERKGKVLTRQRRVRERFNRESSPRAAMLAEKRARYFPWLEAKP